MRHIVAYSGGKDSTALLLWAKANLADFTAVFCDTQWEHPITYAYLLEIDQQLLGGKLVRLTSRGMRDLVQVKKRVPSAKARFCTEELKVKIMAEWLRQQDDECIVYQGIRADESPARAKMGDEEWSDVYDAIVRRPLLRWTADEVFKYCQANGVKPNPLYLMGAGRVGCFPCVMINLRELKAYLGYPETGPLLRERVLELETLVGRSFWPPNYIPDRFQTGRDENDKSFPWAADVFKYVDGVTIDQLPLLPAQQCMSVYNLCE